MLATTAPAVAASGPAALSVSVTGAQRQTTVVSGATYHRVAVTSTISNPNRLPSQSLTVSMTVTLDSVLQWGTTPDAVATGWTGGTAPTGLGASRTFTYTADAQIASNSTKAFNPLVRTFSTVISTVGTVSVTATPGGAGSPGTGTRPVGT